MDECKPLITGSHGIMLVGPASKMQEPVMLAFLSLRQGLTPVHISAHPEPVLFIAATANVHFPAHPEPFCHLNTEPSPQI